MNLQLAVRVHDSSYWSAVAVAIIGALLLAVAVRVVLDHPPHYDELLHALAAEGVLKTGEPSIADGHYLRAELYTRTVAVAYELAGGSLISARLPALVAGMLLVALIGAWTTRKAGLVAGAFSGVVLALLPTTVEMSVFARFYTMHALTIAISLTAGFEAMAPSRNLRGRIAMIVLALLALVISRHLQESTMVALAAAVPALFAVWVYDHWSVVRVQLQLYPLRWAGVAAGVVLVGLVVAWQFGFLERLRESPLWLSGMADAPNYYNNVLRRELPLLWPLLPVAVVLAISFQPRIAILCTVFSLVVLLIHSIAAQKAVRYVFYTLPFLCVLYGLAFAAAVSWITAWIRRIQPRAGELAVLAAVLLLGATWVNSAEGTRAVKLIVGRMSLADFSAFANEADWDKAAAPLKALLSQAETVVASSGFKALHTLGRYDYELNASVVYETDTAEEFGRDPRTGRQVIGTAQSMERIIDKPGDVLVVADRVKVGMPVHIPRDVANMLDMRCSKVILPRDSRTVAWWCTEQESPTW